MKLHVVVACLCLDPFAGAVWAQSTPQSEQKFSPPSRTFRFTYSFTVEDIPAGTQLVRIWDPVADTDEHQTVRLVASEAAVKA